MERGKEGMTEAELQNLERLDECERDGCSCEPYGLCSGCSGLLGSVADLIAEVRRLRGLVPEPVRAKPPAE